MRAKSVYRAVALAFQARMSRRRPSTMAGVWVSWSSRRRIAGLAF
jgi:hypothetical protein